MRRVVHTIRIRRGRLGCVCGARLDVDRHQLHRYVRQDTTTWCPVVLFLVYGIIDAIACSAPGLVPHQAPSDHARLMYSTGVLRTVTHRQRLTSSECAGKTLIQCQQHYTFHPEQLPPPGGTLQVKDGLMQSCVPPVGVLQSPISCAFASKNISQVSIGFGGRQGRMCV